MLLKSKSGFMIKEDAKIRDSNEPVKNKHCKSDLFQLPVLQSFQYFREIRQDNM